MQGVLKNDSDGSCEVDEHPSGSTDTLLQEPDVGENANRVISFAPGEGNKLLGIFMDKDSEHLSFPHNFLWSLYHMVQFANGSLGVRIEELQCLCQTFSLS